MRISAYLFALTLMAGAVNAQPRIDQLCGQGHVNETAALGDVTSNPDGYYVRSLQTQLSHGDERIIHAVGENFHLCTRSAATPEMDRSSVFNMSSRKAIKYLFVPVDDAYPFRGS